MSELKRVEQWILDRNPSRDSIPGDIDLIENRLIDSLAFAEFVLFIEEISGITIDLDNLDVEDFRSLDAIGARFFAVKPAGEAV